MPKKYRKMAISPQEYADIAGTQMMTGPDIEYELGSAGVDPAYIRDVFMRMNLGSPGLNDVPIMDSSTVEEPEFPGVSEPTGVDNEALDLLVQDIRNKGLIDPDQVAQRMVAARVPFPMVSHLTADLPFGSNEYVKRVASARGYRDASLPRPGEEQLTAESAAESRPWYSKALEAAGSLFGQDEMPEDLPTYDQSEEVSAARRRSRGRGPI
jgi:hypothetical protein